MKLRRHVASMLLLLLLQLFHSAPFLAAQDAIKPVTITAVADREDALYSVGETARFTIEATTDGQPIDGRVVCRFSKDGVAPLSEQTIVLKDGKGVVEGRLNEPGFLQLRAGIGKATAMAAAGFDPLKLEPSMPVPDDFDHFWTAQKRALSAVPVKSEMTPVKSPVQGVEAFDIKVDCLGASVSGYFGRPQNAKPKSLPAILFVHGAGVRSSNLSSVSWAKREGGMLSLDINAHGIANGKPNEYYEQLAAGDLKDYRSLGQDDREKCYFKGMFLRLIRAIDFLTQQPEWDGKTLIVSGSSQGGFQAFAAAGLDSRVSFICAGVPAGCDHTGTAVGRVNGWPKLVSIDADGKPNTASTQAARYFDCVNFATRAKCQGAVVTVGFIDTTCPPTSVYAAYNALTIPKSIHTDVLSGHTNTPDANKFMQEAALKHVREMK
jgi:cephalosporin-C deacetylase